MENREYRNYSVEFRKCGDKEKRVIEGRAIPFNVFSPNREGFRECIAPSAVEGVIEASDIKLLYNHQNDKGFLARSKKGKGSLRIDVREDGVYFEFEAKSDNLSNYVYERLCNGELDETSFAFTVGEEEWKKCDDGTYERTITKFERLYDFSVVDSSYYGIEGAVGCKRFAELQEADAKALEEAKKAEEEKRQAEEDSKIAEYYKQLREENAAYINQESE